MKLYNLLQWIYSFQYYLCTILKGCLSDQAEIIPTEPGQVMLPRDGESCIFGMSRSLNGPKSILT